MRFRTKILQIRMWLALDPWARRAKVRYAELQRQLELDRIRMKATLYITATSYRCGDRILVNPRVIAELQAQMTTIITAPADDGQTIFEMPTRPNGCGIGDVEHASHYVTEEGLLVHDYDQDDPDFKRLAELYGFGDSASNNLNETLGAMAENTLDDGPLQVIELPDGEDPFKGIVNLG